ncbi:FAD-binding-3 domain-containing protein [Mycena chlorophos]|uniref:FAD-binding-3 domain-containing protein n=1 Tax=Mycena chlorophos TaxID=658473 RepID=A0A8H6RZR2_MYCCL|nr:FAD-binding-3 domain-containing protein [Mycena chlorophos]
MLPTTTSAGAFPDTASLQGGFPSFAFTQNPYVAEPSSQNKLHGGSADPNSVELFLANIQMAQEDVLRVHELAKRALDDLQNAYSPGRTPTQADANMAALRQSLEHLAMLLRQSGVGGLPLLSSPNAPSEDSEALLNVTNRTLQEEYERQKRAQDGASIVANRLGHQTQR